MADKNRCIRSGFGFSTVLRVLLLFYRLDSLVGNLTEVRRSINQSVVICLISVTWLDLSPWLDVCIDILKLRALLAGLNHDRFRVETPQTTKVGLRHVGKTQYRADNHCMYYSFGAPYSECNTHGRVTSRHAASTTGILCCFVGQRVLKMLFIDCVGFNSIVKIESDMARQHSGG